MHCEILSVQCRLFFGGIQKIVGELRVGALRDEVEPRFRHFLEVGDGYEKWTLFFWLGSLGAKGFHDIFICFEAGSADKIDTVGNGWKDGFKIFSDGLRLSGEIHD